MKKSTVGALLDGELDEWDRRENPVCTTEGGKLTFLLSRVREHRIYVVRDGNVVFYVGQSKNPVERLWGHLGIGSLVFGGQSQLGRFIEVNLPEAREWQIELLTVADCSAHDVDHAEQLLIDLYTPYLNIRGKQKRSGPLPERYKTPWAKIANLGVKLE